MEGWKPNPKLYRKLSEPRPVAAVQENFQKFFEGVQKLREDCGILNVAVACMGMASEGEEEFQASGDSICGDPFSCYMLALAHCEKIRASLVIAIEKPLARIRS